VNKFTGLGLCLLFFTSSAGALDLGVGVKAGTAGVGVDLSVALSKTVNARLSLTNVDETLDEAIEISDADNSANVDATMDLGFGATGLLLDWYVFDGTFHVTAGMMRNDSKIDFNGRITDAQVTFGGTTYDVAADFSDPNLSGSISAGESFEPYLGVGWGRKAGDDPGLALSVELGVMLMSPEVDLRAPTATNPANQPTLDANVDDAESAAKNDLSELEMWPILSFGLNYAF
jgi:hypothetical protein